MNRNFPTLRLRATAAWMLLVLGVPCQESKPAPPGACLQAMQGVSQGFLDLERALVAGRAEDVGAGAAELARRSLLIPAPEAVQRAPEQALFGQARARLVAAAEELAAHGRDRNQRFLPIGLQRVRLACVSCHLEFRVETARTLPARRNTVWGRVRVESQDGAPREDQSGVVVFLDALTDQEPLPPPAVYPTMSQKGQQFHPRVLPVVRDTEVSFPNDDAVFHNVFSLSKPKPFDLGIYTQGTTRTVAFPEAGLVRVFCNIHPDMAASILILNNPCFAVTDERGRFVLMDLPDGTHTLRTWHELGGGDTRPLELSGPVMRRIDLTLRETSRAVPHKNKFGQPYREKYR